MGTWLSDLGWLLWAVKLALLLVLLWLLLSPIAFLLALIAHRLRLLVDRPCRVAQERLELLRERHGVALERARGDMRSDPFLSSRSASLVAWRLELDQAQQTGQRLCKALEGSSEAIRPLRDRLSKIQLRAERAHEAIAALPPTQIPELQILQSETGRKRVGVIHLLASLVVLVPTAVANAMLSSQIIAAMGLPPIRVFGNVGLEYVVAIILVIVETGTGFLLAKYTAEARTRERYLSFGQLLFFTLACAVVVLETGFYSLMASEVQEKLNIVGLAQVQPSVVFGVLGFVLAAVIVGFGHLLYDSLVAILESRTPKSVGRELRRLTAATEQQLEVAQELSRVQGSVRSAGTELDRVLSGQEITAVPQDMVRSLETMRQGLPSSARLTDAELSALEYESYIWCLITVAGTLAATVVWGRLFLGLLRRGTTLAYATGLAAALGVFGLSFCMSLLFLNRSRHDRDWVRNTAVVAVGVFGVGLVAWALQGSSGSAGRFVVWVVPAVILAAAGVQLSRLSAFLRFVALRTAFIAEGVARGVSYLLVGGFRTLLAILGEVLASIALPFCAVWRRITGADPLRASAEQP